MAINFTISASGTNIVNQADIDASLSKNLNIENFSDDQNNLASIDDYTFEWYFIDKPSSSSCSFDTTITSNNKTIRLDAIDTWGSYRIFCIAKETANVANKSNDNPLRAEETSFINIIVKSSNNLLEKPASFQRDWKSQYDNLVDVVDNTTKRVNKLKVSNLTTFILPTSDGTNGQFITTNGAGLLSFSSLDLSNMETNLSLNSLTDVNVVNPTDGHALVWNVDHWEPGEVSGGNASLTGLTSDGSSTLTITDGYNLVPNTDNLANSGVNIGTLASPFTEVNSQFVYCDTLFAGGVEYPASDGQPNTYLKTNGVDGTSFSVIAYSEISGVPDISSFIELTDLSVTQNASSGNGTLSYDNTSGVLTYTPPDLSNLGGGGGGGISNLVDDTTPQLGGDLDGQAFNITTTGQIKYQNVFATEGDLPNATTYHGMFAHVHATGKAYFSHGGNWIKLIDETSSTTDNVPEGSNNLYFTDQRADTRATLRVQAANLETLNNVNSNINPTDGQVLKWDNLNSKWDAANENVKSYVITANGSSAYRITGPGLDGTADNPDLYLVRGENYSFTNNAGTSHPFDIETTAGSSYSTTGTGLSDNSLSDGELASWQIAMNAPSQLRYQCSNHSGMLGNIYILDAGSSSGSGLTNWTENASGHIIPNANATYDIGNAENKVRHLFLSDNSLFIGDTSISLSTNSNISSDNSNKSFELGASSIDMDSYKFSFSDTSPTSISGGITYRIKSIGSADFTLVGAKFNQVGHIFTASTDGTPAGLADDGVSFVSQSENYDKVSLFVERDMMNSQNIKLRYNASGESKEVITISGSPMDIPNDPGILTYNSGSWTASTLSSLSIKKTITEKHSGEWSTIIDYPDDPNNPGSKLNTFTSSGGSSKFLFAIKNNSGNSMSIKKITLTCSEMYSSTIDWTAAIATDAEFTTNVATKLSSMSNQRIEQTNESGGVGIGTVTFEDSNYNSLSNDYWLVIAINAISAGASADKNFTVSFSYT